ncbi:HAMP domain-containing protein [Candidatus Woesearchaeota archaeon]|nr:HAMP domain-containing protein [Candidatus Woesearchaeota archaeon]
MGISLKLKIVLFIVLISLLVGGATGLIVKDSILNGNGNDDPADGPGGNIGMSDANAANADDAEGNNGSSAGLANGSASLTGSSASLTSGTAEPADELPEIEHALNFSDMALISLSVVLLFVIISAVVFSAVVVKPVDDMIIATQLIAEGHYDQKIRSKGGDELGRLANSFNDMAYRLSSTIKQRSRFLDMASQEKQKSELLIDSMADSVIVTDSEHRIVIFNPAAEILFEIDREKMLNRHIAHLLKRYSIDRLFSSFPEIDKNRLLPVGNVSISSVEMILEKPRKRVIKATVAPVKNERNLITGTITVIEDITKLKEIDDMKNEFISTVSHELRTPLTSIIGYTTLLLDEKFGRLQKDQMRAIGIVKKESDVLHELIDDILDLSKLEAGKAKAVFEETDIRDVISKCPAIRLPEKKGIHLKQLYPENLPMIMADRAKLSQVFTNIISNAVKFTKENGTITVKAMSKKDHVIIDIRDTGIGIKKSEIPKLFNKFYQVQSHLTRTQTGTGLGLPIVKEIIGLHNGLLSVKSVFGKGTTVSIALPKEHTELEEAEKQPACWEIKKCNKVRCPAYKSNDKRCWLTIGTFCKKSSNMQSLDKIDVCTYCSIYRKVLKDAKEKKS